MEIRTALLRECYPNAPFGLLQVRDFTQGDETAFEQALQEELAACEPAFQNYLRADFVQKEPISHYVRYFKKFKKTYFVLQQMESVFVKKQGFPRGLPAVQALFLTELKHGVLIAACDTDSMEQPLCLDVAQSGETCEGPQGEVALKQGDLILRDAKGVVVSNIYGQNARTRVTEKSRNLLFVIMGVEGLSRDAVEAALADLLRGLRLFDSGVSAPLFEVLG